MAESFEDTTADFEPPREIAESFFAPDESQLKLRIAAATEE